METSIDNRRYRIPQDILMDVLRILFRARVKHKITGIKEKENIILLQADFSKESKNHKQAQENLEDTLQEYTQYMEGMMSDETLFMDEDEEND